MADYLRIRLKKQCDATVKDGKIVNETKPSYAVYACTDGISCWIGSCTNAKNLERTVSEKNLLKSINEEASEDELDCLIAALECNDYEYDFFGETRTAIEPEED